MMKVIYVQLPRCLRLMLTMPNQLRLAIILVGKTNTDKVDKHWKNTGKTEGALLGATYLCETCTEWYVSWRMWARCPLRGATGMFKCQLEVPCSLLHQGVTAELLQQLCQGTELSQECAVWNVQCAKVQQRSPEGRWMTTQRPPQSQPGMWWLILSCLYKRLPPCLTSWRAAIDNTRVT